MIRVSSFLIALCLALIWLAGCASAPKKRYSYEGHPFRFAGRMEGVLCIGFYAREGNINQLKEEFRKGMGESAQYVKTSNVPCDPSGGLAQCTISRPDGHAITFVYVPFILAKFKSDCVNKGHDFRKL